MIKKKIKKKENILVGVLTLCVSRKNGHSELRQIYQI